MTVKEGDFLLVNFTLKVKESGETVDTTIDSVAKEARLHREDNIYQPRFVVLGEGSIPKGLEDSLLGLEPGTETTIELTPDKGYGARDPGKMRLVSLRRFREKGEDPIPGRQVEFDGRHPVVRAVGAGRVQLDYNHPLAGRTLIYDISVEKVLEDRNDKILNLVIRRIPEVSSDKFKLDENGNELTIEVPEEAFDLSGLQVAKRSIVADLEKYLPQFSMIAFREVFKRTTPAGETAEPSEEPAKTEVEQATPERQHGRAKKSTEPRKRSRRAKKETEITAESDQ